MVKSMLRAALAASVIVALVGCDKGSETAAPTASTAPAAAQTPDGAILTSITLLKQGDIAGVMQNALPPADFAKLKADWGKDANDKPITEEDRQKFNETMTKLTAPDAEQALYAEIEPKLKEFDAQYTQQIPMYATAGSGWLKGMIQQNKTMSEQEQTQAIAAVDALANWVQKTRFTDPEAVKKVVAIVVKTARELNLKTLDEAHALTYDQSMQKARVVFLGVKDVLNVYGFSLDQTLDSVKPQVQSNDGKAATVQVAYTLFGAPLTATTPMVNIDGRWYGKQTIDKLKEKAAEDAATPADVKAPAAAEAAPKQG